MHKSACKSVSLDPINASDALKEVQPCRIHIDQYFFSIRYGRLDIVRAIKVDGPAGHVLISQVFEREMEKAGLTP